MWTVIANNLQMAEGDYGIKLPVTISGTTLEEADNLRFTFSAGLNDSPILVKNYPAPSGNTVQLEFSEQESALFPVGTYYYSLDWTQNGVFMCNIITSAKFKVVDKV